MREEIEQRRLPGKYKRFWNRYKRYIKVTAIIGTLAFGVRFYINYMTTQEQLEIERDNHKITKEQIEQSKRAEIYIDFAVKGVSDTPVLKITNIGNKLADSIWISQRFYLVQSNGDVYDCDLPSFCYMQFNRSKRKMFKLDEGKDTTIVYKPTCFNTYKQKLLHKYPGNIIVSWRADFNQGNSAKRSNKDEYFVLINNDYTNPQIPSMVPGGLALANAVEEYRLFSLAKVLTFNRVLGEYELSAENIGNNNILSYEDDQGNTQILKRDECPPKNKSIKISVDISQFDRVSSPFAALLWNCDDTDSLLGRGLKLSREIIY